MEIIRGKQTSFNDSAALAEQLAAGHHTHIDIGTGDGRFAVQVARDNPSAFVIGLDACRENLRDISRRAPANCLFAIANASTLPAELDGSIDNVSINFPWGSLLESLLSGEAGLFDGLRRLSRGRCTLEVRLNGGALSEAGWQFEAGVAQVKSVLAVHGFAVAQPKTLTSSDLRAFPSTWARRIAFGRDPRAALLSAHQQLLAVALNDQADLIA